MNNTQILNLGLAVVAVILIVSAAYIIFSPVDRKPADIRIGYFQSRVNDLPVFIAEKQGWFEEAGLDVLFIPVPSDEQAMDAMRMGRIDLVTMADAVAVLKAASASDGKISLFNISPVSKNPSFDGLVSLSGSQIRRLDDLDRKKVGLPPGDDGELLIKNFLVKKGINTRTIEFQPLSFHKQIQALKNQKIDVLYAYEPQLTMLLEGQDARRIHGSVLAELLPDKAVIGAGGISSTFLQQKPQIASKVVDILRRGYSFMEEEEDSARSILQKQLRLSDDAAQNISFLKGTLTDQIDNGMLQSYVYYLRGVGAMRHNLRTSDFIYRELEEE